MSRRFNDRDSRQVAQRQLEGHWNFVRRLAREGLVHFCVWNKYHHPERKNEIRHGLIDGMEFLDFVRTHRAWFGCGAYDRRRNTFAIWLTQAGRSALRTRAERAEMMRGGLVEPGYEAMPLQFHRDLNEQRGIQRARRGLPTSYIRELMEKPEPMPVRRRRTSPRAA